MGTKLATATGVGGGGYKKAAATGISNPLSQRNINNGAEDHLNSNLASRSGSNNGSFLGGIGYAHEKLGLGFLSGIEGVWDFAAGGLADLFGADEWAERQFANDWVNYNHADEWFDPGKGWQVAGDVSGGIGTSLPSIAAAAAVMYFSKGTMAPVAAKMLVGGTSATVAGLSAAGNATKEAYRETGELTGKEYGYGLQVGVTEAGIEALTSGFAKGTGRFVNTFMKEAAGEGAEAVAKTAIKGSAKQFIKNTGKQLAEDFAQEAFEEGFSEFITPYYKRATYDPQAKNATLGEIGYSALVGGLSGMVMSGSSIGVNAAVNTTQNFFAGKNAVEKGRTAQVIKAGKYYADSEAQGVTGIESYASAADIYGKLTDSLMKNNAIGDVDELISRAQAGSLKINTKERMLLGKLQRADVIGKIYPAVEKSAMALVMNPEGFTQAFSAFGMTDADGNKLSYTADQITEGIDVALLEKARSGKISDKEYVKFLKQLRAAIKTNPALATLSVADATGRMIIDSKKFETAAKNGAARMTPDTLAQYKEKATRAQKEAFARDLGYNTLEEFYSDKFEGVQARLEQYLYDNAEEIAARVGIISQVKSATPESIKKAPKVMKSTMADGIYSLIDNGAEFAIVKNGAAFYLYSYATGDISRPMNVSELNKHLKKARELSSVQEQKTDSARSALSSELYVEIDLDSEIQKELSAVTPEERGKIVERELKIAAKAGIEYEFHDETVAIMDNSDISKVGHTKFEAKARASVSMKALAKVARLAEPIKNVEHPKFKAFKYYKARVKIGQDLYECVINVGLGKFDGKYHIYDVNQFDNIERGGSPILSNPRKSVEQTVSRATTSMDIIPQNSENSNTFAENISKDAANLSENENSAEKVGAETEERAENVHEEVEDAAENVTETAENRAEEAEDKYSAIGIGIWARENVSGYGEISEPAKRIVRDTIRQARALGKADSDIKLVATVAARSGLNIVYDSSIEGDGLYLGNTIYVNPELSIERTCQVLLGHEMFHKLFASGSKGAMKLYNQARKLVSDTEAREIRERYEAREIRERYEARDKKADQDAELRRILSGKQKKPVFKSTRDAAEQKKKDSRNAIYEEEVAAHGAETVFNSADAWEYILSEEPSFKEKVLGFFRKSAQDYSSIKELSAQSRKFLREYKKLFKELEARNQGNNALSRALETTQGEKETVTSTNDENMQVTERAAIKYPVFSESDIAKNMNLLADMDAVAIIDPVKLEKTGKAPMEIFDEYFNSLGKRISSQVFGDIELSKSSTKSEIRHGITAEKIASIEAIPSVIENGKVIFDKEKEAGVERIVVAAPIKIGNADYYMGVMLQRDARYQRLYLHNVVSIEIERKAISFSKDNLVTTGALEKDNHLPITIILQKAVNVKINKQNKDKKHVGNSSGERHALPKTDKKASDQGASTVADPDKIEVSRGKLEQMRANYKGDKVFYKKDVVDALKGIDALARIPADMREDIANRLWRGYNIRLNSQGFDLFTETMYYKLHAEILQESDFEMSREDLAVMDEQIYAALAKIVESGKPSARASVKAEVEAEFKHESIEAELKEYKKIVNDKYKARNDSREATRKREQVRRQIGRINRLLFNPTKEKNIPYAIQSIIADAMRAEDISTVDMVKLDEVQTELDKLRKKDDSTEPSEDIIKKIIALEAKRDRLEARTFNMKKTIDALNEAYAKFEDADDPLAKRVFDSTAMEKLAEYTKIIGDTPIKRMNLGQLNALIDYYALLRKKIDNANQLFHDIKSMKLEDAGRSIIREFDALHVPKILEEKSGQLAYKSTDFIWKSLKPLHFFEVLGSDTLNRAFLNLRAGEDVWARDAVEAAKYFKAAANKYGFRDWDMDSRTAVKIGGKTVQLTLGQKMSLYAYSKRTSSHEHLKNGGFIFSPDATYKGKNAKGKGITLERLVADSQRYTMDEITLARMSSALELTKEQIGFVDEMQKYLSKDLAEKGNEVSLKLHGIKLFNDEFYLPMIVASEFLDSQTGKTGDPKIKNKGMTKKLTPEAKNPLVLTDFMDVWKRHVNDMALYHGMTLPMEDINALLNYRNSFGLDAAVLDGKGNADINKYDSVKEVMRARYGSAPADYIAQLLRDINGGAISAAPSKTLDKLISKYKKCSVAVSASVVAQQPSSIARALSEIDPKYFAALPKLNKSGEYWERIKKYAPVAIIKEIGGFDTGTGQTLGSYITANEYRGIAEKIKGFFKDSDYREGVYGFLASEADKLTWIQIFEACVREQKDLHTELSVDSEELLTLAGQRFTEVITKTQVYDSTLSRSEFMRSKDTGWKMATAFMAEPTTVSSEVILAAVQFTRGEKEKLVKVLASLFVAAIMNAFLSSFVYAARDDDEDKTYFEKYITSFINKTIEQMNPFTWFPFIKDIYSIFQGYDVERMDMAMFADLYNAVSGLRSDSKTTFEKAWNFVGSISTVFGIPLRNVMRDARGLYNVFNSFITGEPGTWAGTKRAALQGFDKTILAPLINNDVTNGEEMYSAIMRGDTAHYNRIRARYKTDSSAETALRTALRDQDPRIEAAAKAKLDGDTDTYQRLVFEIFSEGKFDRSFIVRAITSEYLAIKRDLEDAGYTVFVGDEMYTLTEEQKTALELKRAELVDGISNIEAVKGFGMLSADQQELAKNYAEDLANYVAESVVLGVDHGKNAMISELLGVNKTAICYALTKGIEPDKDKQGKTISGSKREKTISAIQKLNLSAAEKLLFICSKGYSIKDGDIPGLNAASAKKLLLRYILANKTIDKDKKARLAELCGFTVKNGKILPIK